MMVLVAPVSGMHSKVTRLAPLRKVRSTRGVPSMALAASSLAATRPTKLALESSLPGAGVWLR